MLGVVGESLRDNRIAVLADNGICLEGSLPGMRCAKDAQAQVAGAREYFECFECWQWLQYSDSSARVLASNTRLQKHDAQGTRGGGGGRLARSCCLLKSGGAGTHGGK